MEKKSNQRWLWLAIDHRTGETIAFVFGRRKDEVFMKLKELLEPFNIGKYYTDNWGSYSQNLDKNKNPKIVAAKFDSYLKSLWKRAIVPNHGLMVFLGHPMYSGINETTIKPVENMVQLAKEDNAWITNLDEVAEYWNKIKT